jgi:hypothetical protein
VVVAASIMGCLAPAETDSIGVAAEAVNPWQPPIPWSPTPAPIATPPSFPRPLTRMPPQDTEAIEPAQPPAPSRPAPIPLSAGAALFAQIAACRQSAADQGGGLANARAMLCLAGVLRSAAGH